MQTTSPWFEIARLIEDLETAQVNRDSRPIETALLIDELDWETDGAELEADDLDELLAPEEATATVVDEEEQQALSNGEFCPTPEQIRAECQRIQAGWSERERLRRAGYPNGRMPRWQPPELRLSNTELQDLAWAV